MNWNKSAFVFGGQRGLEEAESKLSLESASVLPGVWVLLAVHFRPSSEFLAVDRSVSHTFISRLPFIHQFSVLLPSRQFSLSDRFGPVENSAVPHGTQGAPTSAGARASRLVAGSFQKAAPGPQRTWQGRPPQKTPMPILWAGRLLRVS